MMNTDTTAQEARLYDIFAIDGTGTEVHCFTWRYGPEAGIERAKRDAKEFGQHDLHDFWAEEVRDGPHCPLPRMDDEDGPVVVI